MAWDDLDAEGEGSALVVVTYNVHRCVGRDGRHDPERVAAVIAETRADVVALQEVDARYGIEDGVDQFERLASLCGLDAVPGPTLERGDARYGNAVLTRLPVKEVRRVDLSVRGREPRGALDLRLVAGRTLRVLACHLGLALSERLHQVRRLARHLDEDPEDVCLLLGDLNEWRRMGSLRGLRRHVTPGPRVATFPSRRALFPLDRIWTRPDGMLVRVAAHRSPLARVASDHLPLRAEIRLA